VLCRGQLVQEFLEGHTQLGRESGRTVLEAEQQLVLGATNDSGDDLAVAGDGDTLEAVGLDVLQDVRQLTPQIRGGGGTSGTEVTRSGLRRVRNFEYRVGGESRSYLGDGCRVCVGHVFLFLLRFVTELINV
jgi:hypothetical protein